MVSKNKSIIRVRMGKKSVPHDVQLLNGDPWDGFFDPTLTLVIYSYIS